MLNTKRELIVLVILLVTMSFAVVSLAAGTGERITLKPTKQHPDASGTAVFTNGNLDILARGLKPNSVYTVWFVNLKPAKHETGAGAAPYMFTTDSSGNGTYRALLNESPFGKWQMIMVVLHPNGNPGDMKNMVGALTAKL
jgi:hypothetical protein